MPKVSVIVPVYNPGANIDECIASLLDQSLPPADYEVIFVDDGSTDETPTRLDALAAEHPHVRVEHIPNSGWPGRPRNIGIDLACGDFVHFVDNDDWIEREALERMWATAMADDADIVVGKVVGHGKYVPPNLFGRNLHAVSLRDAPLVALLSPHKLFRRSFIAEHGLRFPEGRRRLEDHLFVMRAYFATDRVSVLADYPCYHWVRRGSANASSGVAWEPAPYYAAVREVLDVVDEHTEPGDFRDRLYLRWYRAKTLGRVGGYRSPITKRSADWQRSVFDEVRAIVLERFGPELDTLLPFNERLRVALVRAGDFDAVLALAALEIGLGTSGTLDEVGREEGTLVLRATLRLRAGGEPLRFNRHDGRICWVAPAVLQDRIPEGTLDATEDIDSAWAEVLVRSVSGKSQYALPTRAQVVLPASGDGEVGLTVEARLDPASAAGGAPLQAGDHDHPVVVNIAGFAGDGVLSSRRGRLPIATRVLADGSARVRTTSAGATRLAMARRLPRLARAVKRAGGAARRVGRG